MVKLMAIAMEMAMVWEWQCYLMKRKPCHANHLGCPELRPFGPVKHVSRVCIVWGCVYVLVRYTIYNLKFIPANVEQRTCQQGIECHAPYIYIKFVWHISPPYLDGVGNWQISSIYTCKMRTIIWKGLAISRVGLNSSQAKTTKTTAKVEGARLINHMAAQKPVPSMHLPSLINSFQFFKMLPNTMGRNAMVCALRQRNNSE